MEERLIYLIDQLKSGHITNDERQELSAMKHDPAYRDYLNIIDDLETVLESDRADEIRKQVSGWGAESKGSSKRGFIVIGLLAMVLLVMGYLLIKNLSSQTKDPNDIYADYLEPYPNIYLPLDRSNNTSTVHEAMADYENGNFQSSNSLFRNLNDSLKNDRNIIFYKAVNDIMLDKKSDAKKGFSQLRNDSTYGVPANYYLFLLAVDQGDSASTASLAVILTKQQSHPKLASKVEEIMAQLD